MSCQKQRLLGVAAESNVINDSSKTKCAAYSQASQGRVSPNILKAVSIYRHVAGRHWASDGFVPDEQTWENLTTLEQTFNVTHKLTAEATWGTNTSLFPHVENVMLLLSGKSYMCVFISCGYIFMCAGQRLRSLEFVNWLYLSLGP